MGCRGGADALGDLKLEHQSEPFPDGRLTQPADQQGGADIVRQIGDHLARGGHQGGQIAAERVAGDQSEAACRGGDQILQGGDRAVVEFNRQHGFGRTRQQRPGQPARSRPDLHHVAAGQIAGSAHDTVKQVGIEQKMLAKAAFGRQPVLRDDIA